MESNRISVKTWRMFYIVRSQQKAGLASSSKASRLRSLSGERMCRMGEYIYIYGHRQNYGKKKRST